jgi:hypothetical protein
MWGLVEAFLPDRSFDVFPAELKEFLRKIVDLLAEW